MAEIDPGNTEAVDEPSDMPVVPGWTLRMFGRPRAVSERGDPFELERKTAACIALLCVEGPTGRARLAELLWPDVDAEAQRANLRQLARRLKVLLGRDALTSTDPVELDLGVHVDLRRFAARSAASDWRDIAAIRGSLLAGLEFDDCPEFAEWLALTRTRIDWTIAHALSAESVRVAGSEGPEAAIPLILRWLELEPSSEEAYRHLMRLHHLRGDRGAALAAFEVCRASLAKMLDVAPSTATQELAAEIRGTRSASFSPSRPRGRIPLSVLRPAVLAGRADAFEQLTAAVSAGKLAFIMGPAGTGKTRLAQDFASVHPEYEHRYVACRPSDRELPYAYFTRTWRHDLAVYPERSARMQAWVRHEMSRIMPELGPAPPPIVADEERIRFYEANVEMANANDSSFLIITDDAHHMDRASHDLGIHLALHFTTKKSPLRSISTYREEELAPSYRAILESLCDADHAVRIRLQDLSEAELAQLLSGMNVGEIGIHVDALHAFTGGNPFYVVETVKALFENGDPKSLPQALTPSDRVRLTIERRLQLLPSPALQLLRAAAIIDEPLQLSLGARMLDASTEVVGAAWASLERGLLLRGGLLAHELLRMVVLDSMPEGERKLLHHRAATALQSLGVHPARIALHWLAAGETPRAIHCFQQAAEVFTRMSRNAEAKEFMARAEQLSLEARRQS